MQLNSAVLYDAVFLLHDALETLNARNIDNEEFIEPTSLSCKVGDKYQAGRNIISTIKEVSSLIVSESHFSTKK